MLVLFERSEQGEKRLFETIEAYFSRSFLGFCFFSFFVFFSYTLLKSDDGDQKQQ